MKFLAGLLMCCTLTAMADERVAVCFNYGCLAQEDAVFSEVQLGEALALLRAAPDAAGEREALAVVVGKLLGWAGQQTPIAADRGGNYADDAVYGKMDCIDHSTTTTRLLRMIERRGGLRYHRVLEPALRMRFWLFMHYSALIEAVLTEGRSDEVPAQYVVDSWFHDNGQPAVVMPLANWKSGEGPYVGE